MGALRILALVALVLLLLVGVFSIFTVEQREKALLLRLGKIVPRDLSPGLHFKVPFIDQVRKFDGRILTLDAKPERYLTKEKKNVIVDSFVMWRIKDVARYYTAMGGDELRASLRLSQIIKDGLRSEFGKRTIQEVVSGERRQIMDILTRQADAQADPFGIRIVDVRIKRIDLPEEVQQSVYRRMEAERARKAKELRSEGAEAAERIRAEADRERTVILAKAYKEAETLRGEGDALAADIYAKAYGKDPEFYAFYRSLNAYRASMAKDTLMVLEPEAAFFRYFQNPKGQD